MRRAARHANLRRLLSPRHVAFIGGQRLAPTIGYCVDAGFAGQIWPVNPTYPEIGGHRCFRSLADLPAPPDATFIAVPRELTIDMVRELSAMGAGGAVCYAAGYAEVGGEGLKLQESLVAAAGDIALVGPNCYGILNYVDGVAMFASGFGGGRVRRGVAIIAQSGNLALNLTQNDRSVPIAYVITAGNQARYWFMSAALPRAGGAAVELRRARCNTATWAREGTARSWRRSRSMETRP